MPSSKKPSSTATTSGPASAAGFFQRGRKPTTAHRAIAVKTVVQTSHSQDGLQDNTTQDEFPRVSTSDKDVSLPIPSKGSFECHPTSLPGKNTSKDNRDFLENNHEREEDSWGEIDRALLESIFANDNDVTDTTAAIKKKHPSPSVNPTDPAEIEKLLRQFDLLARYGPCLNMTRLERWERASKLGLDPPFGVKEMLLANQALNHSLFTGLSL
ncbi:hypothetical protein BG011_001069 [Mortierella polycephala]|uniref:DNA polymerase delta subunit 4 n=1 Tax=Mortierella polycephala TaxID=41804 RepID=A0A9P6Q9C2_9FUNG|nr:hypothetical protein BG011_001069 [Mortierella polycephala]